MLAIGNTRIRAAVFDRDRQIIAKYAVVQQNLSQLEAELSDHNFDKIAIASVVTDINTCWHGLEQTQIIRTSDIPLQNLYPTMGVDRALAAFGAGEIYGYPVLVIDAGTALTLTGIDATQNLVGGAIVAGLRSQFTSLHHHTSALPSVTIPKDLPPRWATNTIDAMQGGVAHLFLSGLQSYIDDWRSQFPDSQIIMTGGDSDRLRHWGLPVDAVNSDLIFLGMWHCQ